MATFEQFRSTFPEDSNEKGKAFEVFLAEWMFKNHCFLSRRFRKVWRFSDWPRAWSSTDIGTDLIAEDQDGKIWAIQAKFYKKDGTIPKRDIDSFLSDTNRAEVDYRLLIATTDGLGKNARNAIEGQEKPVHSFTLKDFLETPEWPESLELLNKFKPRKPHKVLPHQKKAITDVTKKLESRGQLLMACGTGKTLTGQRIAEKFESKSTLVLLPSLLLLSKTVKDWVSEREQDFMFLPVCSDKSVTKQTDEIAISDSELCFRSTTDTKEIAEFLKRSENKVIFSTYQSSPQIAEAFKKHRLKPFDLILADEAHRCAGKISSEYSTVLSEDLIPAKKRLFMTATPRMYTANLRKKAKDADIEVASMDDEALFGPVLHHLTFGQAITNDPPLLTDYRALVVGVNDAMCKEMVETRAFVKTESGLEDDARSIATQLGLSKAVKDYDLKRVISFHSRVNLARDFASGFLEFQSDLKSKHKPKGKITYSHVSGKMPTSERSKKLRALGNLDDEDRYLLGNARCLSEGVDVPALDGVAFVDPRRSEIDIIQAVGRAIRLSDGKETGTIIIPVFISDSDDPDEVLSTSEFDQVWKVVNALRSHDESLGEMLDQCRVGLGRKQKISFKNTKIVFDVPKRISNEFVEAFETKLVETTTASWEFWYGLLVDYKEANGNCLVPAKYKVDGFALGSWVLTQRGLKALMNKKRLDKLNSIGFIWDPLEETWNEGFELLSAYKKANGNCNVTREYRVNDFNLGAWVHAQRTKSTSIAKERLDKLNALGFIWNLIEEEWNKGFELLSSYKESNGNCLVPYVYKVDGFNLGYWVGTQRRAKTSMTKERLDKLNLLGFVWDPTEGLWNQAFGLLYAYKKASGNCNVPQSYKVNDFSLGSWVTNQRLKKNQLTREQLDKLDALGFVWNQLEYAWNQAFGLLSAYKKAKGNCLVPHKYNADGFSLGQWVGVQRRNKTSMSRERLDKLNLLGFAWDPYEEAWSKGFELLSVYKESNGNCLVPFGYKVDGFNLGSWVSTQRQNKTSMTKERLNKLNSLGFVWKLL